MRERVKSEESGIAEVKRAAEEALTQKPPSITYQLTRRGLFIFSLLIGLALAGVVVLGFYGYFQFNKQNADIKGQADRNALAIKRLDRVTKELKRITNPTPEQYRDALKTGIERCLKEPECKKLFPGITKRAKHSGTDVSRDTSRRVTSNGRDGSPSRGTSPEKRGNTGDPSPAKPRKPHKPGGGGGGNGGATPTQTPAPTAEPTPAPTVDLHAPLVPPVCIGNIVHINCDKPGRGLGRDKNKNKGLSKKLSTGAIYWLSFKVTIQ